MSRSRPSAAEERWLVVGADLARTGGWRTVDSFARCGLFVLGAMTAGLFGALVEIMGVHQGAWFFALLVLGAAEFLIFSRQVFAGGFEEALEVAGAVGLVFSLHASGASAELWLLGGAVGVVGLRLLNPLFTTMGVGICVAALAETTSRWPITICACYAVAALALAASTWTYRRPSYDRMLGWLIVATPLGASIALSAPGFSVETHGVETPGVETLSILTFVLAATLGCASLSIGIARRMHAPLLAFLVCVLCVANELRKVSRLPLEARLIIGGCAALLAAIVLDRFLRNGRQGITSRAVSSEDATPLDLMQLAGTQLTGSAALATHGAAPDVKFKGGGGNFSGGGAGGTF